MCVCVCVCVFVCVCVYTRTHTCTHAFIDTRPAHHAPTCNDQILHARTRTHTCTHALIHVPKQDPRTTPRPAKTRGWGTCTESYTRCQ